MPCETRPAALRLHGCNSPSRAAISGRSARPCCRPRRRRAMTLIEIVLVLALLVLIGSMIVPVFTGSFANIRLRRAGDQLISSWSQARRQAIETGLVQQFRFTPDTGEYAISQWLGETATEDAAGASPGEAVARNSSPAAGVEKNEFSSPGADTADDSRSEPDDASSADGGADETEKTLPSDVIFYSGQLAAAEPLTQERRIDSMVERGGDQSTPILFFPDGTTSEASVVLVNDRRQYLRVTLRSLTGVARASDVMTSEELQRWAARSR